MQLKCSPTPPRRPASSRSFRSARLRYEVITVRPALSQEAIDLLELQSYWHQARLGLQEVFESGLGSSLMD